MKSIPPHIKFLRNTLLLLVVLFSLTPCSVKESGTLIFNIEYQRPLNKTKAITSQLDSCENLNLIQVEMVKTEKDVVFKLFSKLASSTPFIPSDSEEENVLKQSNQSLNLGLPLYILYSRLKLDIA